MSFFGLDRWHDRIYPVPIKPPSKIGTWDSWPEDVRPMIWGWNHHHPSGYRMMSALSFVRSNMVFKCPDCEQFCVPHANGAAVLLGTWLCDDCLIQRARDAQGRDLGFWGPDTAWRRRTAKGAA